ncbi:MAG: DUF881 domain-containing protein [Vampirovibrionales bacterium]|nr:DUF881 domain-containing protein [Vampirovibrionales bacterium]
MNLSPSQAASTARRLSRRLFPLALALCMAVIGVISGLYWRIESAKRLPTRYSTQEAAHAFRLNRQLAARERLNDDLAQEIQLLTYQMDRKLSQSYRLSQRRKLDRLADYTGLRLREGMGVEIILRDSDRPYRLEENPNVGIIHNIDMLAVVNQLWASGARAIALNDQRIVAGTEINCAGPVLIINQSRIAPPFRLQAIAENRSPSEFLERVNRHASALKQLSAYGIEINMRVAPVRILPYVPAQSDSSQSAAGPDGSQTPPEKPGPDARA